MYILVVGHNKHCPDEAYETPDNPKQHWSKDTNMSPADCPSQLVVLKQTGAVKPKINAYYNNSRFYLIPIRHRVKEYI